MQEEVPTSSVGKGWVPESGERSQHQRWEVSPEGRVGGRGSPCFPWERLWVLGWDALNSSSAEDIGHGLVIWKRLVWVVG